MPREGVHEEGAAMIKAGLSEEGSANRILTENLELYYMGSAFPDAFYFHKFGGGRDDIADQIHGTEGQNTNKPIIEMATAGMGDVDTFALLSGMLTHFAFDQIVHPFVYFATGNYYDDNEARQVDAQLHHRRLEVQMDRDLSSYVGGTPGHAELLRNVAGLSAFENMFEVERDDIVGAMKAELIIGNASFRPFAYKAVKLLQKSDWIADQMGGKALQGIFYGGAPEAVLNPDHPLVYRNPITGMQLTRSFNDMFDEASTKGIKMVNALYEFMFSGNPDRERFDAIAGGEALDSGIRGGKVLDMEYFSPNVDERQRSMR